MKNIVVKDKIINITGVNDDDYVSLTDIARFLNDFSFTTSTLPVL